MSKVTNLRIEIKAPSDFGDTEKDDFIELVIEGGAVDPNGLKGRVDKARLLACCYDKTNILVGVMRPA